MNKCFMNSKIIISAFISKIIAKVLNASFTNSLVEFENNLNKDVYIQLFVAPPLLTKENKI